MATSGTPMPPSAAASCAVSYTHLDVYKRQCYDRYLPMLSPACQIIGIAFDEQRVDRVPTDAHDLPLPHIISA